MPSFSLFFIPPQYLGRWYQTHANAGFILLELGGRCATADYELVSEKKVALVNQARPRFIPRIFARTTGFAIQGDEAEGSFTVAQRYLAKVDEESVEYESPGNYWIIGIGPIVDGQYQWAAVSNPDKTLSFIIARNVDEFLGSEAEEEATKLFEDFGFSGLFGRKPRRTSHRFCFGYR